MGISWRDFEPITYLEVREGENRVVPMYPCLHEDDRVEFWIYFDGHGMIETKAVVGHVESFFFSRKLSSEDFYSEFFNQIINVFSFKETSNVTQNIVEDVKNLLASVAKIEFFHNVWEEYPEQVNTRFITTEIEYILSVSRSMFDLLHEFNVKLFKILTISSGPVQQMRDSYARIALCGETPRSREEIASTWNMPPDFAEFYARHANFFKWMRKARNSIEHHGKTINFCMHLEQGFAIQINDRALHTDGEDIWSDPNTRYREDYGSIRTLVTYIVNQTIIAMEHLGHILAKVERQVTADVPRFSKNHTLLFRYNLYPAWLEHRKSPWKELQEELSSPDEEE